MKVGQQRVDHAEAKARADEQRGLVPPSAATPRSAPRRVARPTRARAPRWCRRPRRGRRGARAPPDRGDGLQRRSRSARRACGAVAIARCAAARTCRPPHAASRRRARPRARPAPRAAAHRNAGWPWAPRPRRAHAPRGSGSARDRLRSRRALDIGRQRHLAVALEECDRLARAARTSQNWPCACQRCATVRRRRSAAHPHPHRLLSRSCTSARAPRQRPLEQQLDAPARGLACRQPRRQHARVVEHQQIARLEQRRQSSPRDDRASCRCAASSTSSRLAERSGSGCCAISSGGSA